MCPPHSQVPQAERARGTRVPASQQGTEFRLPMPGVQLLLLLARADPRGGPGGPGLRQHPWWGAGLQPPQQGRRPAFCWTEDAGTLPATGVG